MMHFTKFMTILVVAMLMACTAPSESGVAAAAKLPTTTTATSDKDASAKPTALYNLLNVFVSEAGMGWKGYDSVTGTLWLTPQPTQYAQGRFQRSGRLLLAGFGTAQLPNGKTGSNYATVEDNEGESGLTLTGDAGLVRMLSVKKFYFSEDYQRILKGQFGVMGKVTPVAQGCLPEEDAEMASNPAFFEVELQGGKQAYVEAFLEEGGKYAPGYTVFDFTREKPVDRINELSCQE